MRWLTGLRFTLLMVLIVGLICQVIQNTDPTPLWCYFTMDSAALQVVLMAALLTGAVRDTDGEGWWSAVRLMVVTAVVVSGIVYAAVIAPAAADGGWWFSPADDVAVKTATTLIHGVAVILAVTEYVTSRAAPPLRRVWVAMLWPAAYLSVMFVITAADGPPLPYPFLRPAAGWLAVAAVAGMAGVILVVAAGLSLSARPRRNVLWSPTMT